MPTNPAFQLPIVASASPVTLLAQGVGASHTGDTSETILATIPVSAGSMGANGLIVVRCAFSKVGTAGGWTFGLRYGLSGSGLSGASLWASGAASNQYVDSLPFVANANSTSAQIGSASTLGAIGQQTSRGSSSIDTAQATEINVTATLVNGADTAQLAFFQALLYPHA